VLERDSGGYGFFRFPPNAGFRPYYPSQPAAAMKHWQTKLLKSASVYPLGCPRVPLSCGSSSNIWPQLLDLLFSGRRGPSSFSWALPSCQHSSSHPLLCPCHFKSKDLELNTLLLSSLSGRKQTPSGHPSFINLVKYSVGLRFKSRAAHCWFTSKVK